MSQAAPTTIDLNSVIELSGEDFLAEDSGSSYGIELINPTTVQFEVQPGDVWAPDPVTKNRAELASQTLIPDGTPISLAYTMVYEPGAVDTATQTILGQFHQDWARRPRTRDRPFRSDWSTTKWS